MANVDPFARFSEEVQTAEVMSPMTGGMEIRPLPHLVYADAAERELFGEVLAKLEPFITRRRVNTELMMTVAAVVAEAVVEIRMGDPKFIAQALARMPPEHRQHVIVLLDALQSGSESQGGA
jgi:hypothetical protein